MHCFTLLLFLLFVLSCSCEKKFVLFASSAPRGHLLPMIELAKGLQATGKYDALIVSEPHIEGFVNKYGVPFAATKHDFFHEIPSSKIEGFLQFLDMYRQIGKDIGNHSFFLWQKLEEVVSQRKPDIIIYEFFAFSAGDFANKHNIPGMHIMQGVTSAYKTDWDHLSLFPFLHLARRSENRLSELNFFERFRNFFVNQIDALLGQLWINEMNKFRAQLGLSPYKSFQDWILLKAKHRVVSLTSFPLDTPRAVLPFVTHTGPIRRKESDANISLIPEELREWLRVNVLEGSQGTILLYVSFGTAWSPEPPEMEKLLRIFDELREHYQKQSRPVYILWARGHDLLKYRGLDLNYTQYFSNKKELQTWFRLEGFLPQKELFHFYGRNITAYITHCGVSSVTEGLLHRIPLFGLPIAADQFTVASRLTDARLGDAANLVTDKKEEVFEEVIALIDSEVESRKNLELTARMLETAGGFEKIERLISFMIETNEVDVAHLIPFDADWPFWKKRSLDVISVLIFASAFGLLILILLLKILWRFLRYLCGAKAQSGVQKLKKQ